MKLTSKQIGLIIVAGLAGIFLAVWAFRTRYGRQLLSPVTRIEERVTGIATPPAAQPRYVGFGEFYDPFAIWPFGASSNYQLFLNTNSGVPTTEVASPGIRTAATAPPMSLFAGNNVSFGGGNGHGRG